MKRSGKEKSPWVKTKAKTIALFLFSPLMTTTQKRACRKRDHNYSFPAKLLLTLLTVNAGGSVISLAGGFLC